MKSTAHNERASEPKVNIANGMNEQGRRRRAKKDEQTSTHTQKKTNKKNERYTYMYIVLYMI